MFPVWSYRTGMLLFGVFKKGHNSLLKPRATCGIVDFLTRNTHYYSKSSGYNCSFYYFWLGLYRFVHVVNLISKLCCLPNLYFFVNFNEIKNGCCMDIIFFLIIVQLQLLMVLNSVHKVRIRSAFKAI